MRMWKEKLEKLAKRQEVPSVGKSFTDEGIPFYYIVNVDGQELADAFDTEEEACEFAYNTAMTNSMRSVY